MKRTSIAVAALAAVVAIPAFATPWYDGGGAGTLNAVLHWINGSGVAVPASSSNPFPVNVVSGGGGGGGVTTLVVTGQVVIAVTGTAVQIGSNALTNGIIVKAKSTNNATCGTVGATGVTNTVNGSGNGYIVCPGEGSSFAVSNSNLIFVNGTAGDIFTFEGN